MRRDRSLAAMLDGEQAELATLANGLTTEQWAAPSLCAGWSVRDVIVHATAHGHRSLRETFGIGDAERRLRDAGPAALLEILRSPVRATAGWDRRLQLVELVIHHQDVRRVLRMPRAIPAPRLEAVLASVLTRWVGRLAGVGASERARGLRLVATDLGWTVGEGAEVRGPGEAILMALAGRPVDVDELTGTGAPMLLVRCSTTHPRAVASGHDRDGSSPRSSLSRR